MYDNAGDARMRLENSMIRYKDKPVLVKGCDYIDNQVILFIEYLSNGHRAEIKCSDPDLNFATPLLGYMNIHGEGYYLSRIPARRWKQGLDSRGVEYQRHGRAGQLNIFEHRKSLISMLEGKYPTYSSAFTSDHTTPFCRIFAIGEQGQVLYKGMEIGVCTADKAITLSPQYSYLRQLWEKSVNEH